MSKRAKRIARSVVRNLKAAPRSVTQAQDEFAADVKRMGWRNVRKPSRQQVSGESGDISIVITIDMRDDQKRPRDITIVNNVTEEETYVGSVISPNRAKRLFED